MATQQELSIIGDIIMRAFNNDAAKFEAYLVRAALQTDLAQLESQARNIQVEANADSAAHQAELVANADARAQKQSEIDSL